MKLLSCYVENYGVLSQRTYHFDGGMTAFCEENGAGKTTLASFIKAMFYGLESYRSNTKEFCDRQRYYPFAGGNFGGNLTFEWEGHVYRIERFFGEKSETADKLDVYCDGVLTDRFAGEIGRTVFGIDRQSFERTLFLDSESVECATTADIGARLAHFLEGSGEDVNYAGAKELLEKAAATLKKTRGSGEIAKERARIQELDERIRNAERTKDGLSVKYAAYDALDKEINALEDTLTRAQSQNELLAKWAQYEYMCNRAKEASDRRDALLTSYPNGVPSEEEVHAVVALAEERRALALRAEAQVLGEGEKATLARLDAMFASGIPEESVLEQYETVAQTLVTLEARIAALEAKEPDARERALIARFDGKETTEQALAQVKEKRETYRKARVAYDAVSTTAEVQVKPVRQARWHLPVAMIAAFVTLLGVALLFVNALLGGVITALGGICLLADGFVYLNNRTRVSPTLEGENAEKNRLAAQMRDAELAAASVLGAYGYNVANGGVEVAFYQFFEDVDVFASLCSREEERRVKLAGAREEQRMLHAALSTFLAQYGLSGERYGELLSRLRVDLAQYHALIGKEKELAQQHASLATRCEALDTKIAAFAEQYGENALAFDRVLLDIATLATLAQTAREEQRGADNYREQMGLFEKPENALVDLERSSEQLRGMRDEKSARLREIEEDERVADTLELHYNEREQAKERMASLEARYRILCATLEMLDAADRRMKDKYVSPIKDRFTYYSALIERAIGERVMISGDFTVTFDVNGKKRSERHLSAGQRSICALCFRLALIENMYGGEIPFLVMDDPFLSMDKAHLERARDVMHELASKTQIVYLCCHESRNLQ